MAAPTAPSWPAPLHSAVAQQLVRTEPLPVSRYPSVQKLWQLRVMMQLLLASHSSYFCNCHPEHNSFTSAGILNTNGTHNANFKLLFELLFPIESVK